MSRINTNVQSMVAQHVLGRQNKALSTSLERLSTGIKINAGKDNPGGLIASENLRSEKAGLSQAIVNAERANSLMGTAEGALNEVSALLIELQTLVTETANSGGLTDEEVTANQQQVDSILSSIDRIANSTQFGGKKLLDGSMDYTTSVSTTNFQSVQVNSARLTDGVTKEVQVKVTGAAEYAHVSRKSTTATGLAADITIEVAGNKGSEVLSFATGATNSDIQTAVNALKDVTGVSATINASDIVFNSTGWGSDAFVSVDQVAGTFVDASDYGKDPTVLINGVNAETDGLTASVRTATLDVDIVMKSSFASATGNTKFGIKSGGATFMIGGDATVSNKASVGIGSVGSSSLGNSSDGFLATLASGQSNSLAGGNAVDAQKIVDAAVSQVSNLRGRLGGFQKFTLSPTINSLEVALENASSAESAIRDTDFAAETSAMTRSQILSNAATNVLAMANSMPQSVLSLLRG